MLKNLWIDWITFCNFRLSLSGMLSQRSQSINPNWSFNLSRLSVKCQFDFRANFQSSKSTLTPSRTYKYHALARLRISSQDIFNRPTSFNHSLLWEIHLNMPSFLGGHIPFLISINFFALEANSWRKNLKSFLPQRNDSDWIRTPHGTISCPSR